MSTLKIEDLHVGVTTDTGLKPILNGINLEISSNETHAIMGPNGSGKSTLAYALAGHPKYEVTSGSVTLDGEDVLDMSVDERAKAGLFLAMQYPVEVPGVTVTNFLRSAKTAIDGEAPKLRTWTKDLKQAMEDLRVDPAFASRNVNEGFSCGDSDELLPFIQDRHRRLGSEAAHVSEGPQAVDGGPARGPRVRQPQRKRGLLRR